MAQDTEHKITLKLALLFIPVSFFSYLFHEFGHWIIGEMLGNDMAYSLNYVWAKNGSYIHANDELYSSIGGPLFTILQALLFLVVVEKFKTIYAYPFVFFAMFMRFFSLAFGGFDKQDEARISALLDIGKYTIGIIVVILLLLIVWRASHILRINLKQNGYFFTISTVCMLLVIGTYKFIS